MRPSRRTAQKTWAFSPQSNLHEHLEGNRENGSSHFLLILGQFLFQDKLPSPQKQHATLPTQKVLAPRNTYLMVLSQLPVTNGFISGTQAMSLMGASCMQTCTGCPPDNMGHIFTCLSQQAKKTMLPSSFHAVHSTCIVYPSLLPISKDQIIQTS